MENITVKTVRATALVVAGTVLGVSAAVVAYRHRERIIGTALTGLVHLSGAFEMPAEADNDDLEPYERDLAAQPVTPTSGAETLFQNAS